MHGGVGGGGREANPYPDCPAPCVILQPIFRNHAAWLLCRLAINPTDPKFLEMVTRLAQYLDVKGKYPGKRGHALPYLLL